MTEERTHRVLYEGWALTRQPHLFRANMLRASIKLHGATGMIPTRGVTITKMFKMAGEYTGKTYKRGQHAQAIADLTVWIDTMKAALPITTDKE